MGTADELAEQRAVTGSEFPSKRPPGTQLDRLPFRPEFGVVIAALIVCAYLAPAAPHFATERITESILLASATLGIIGVGVATLMITGQFDVSAGTSYWLPAGVVRLPVNPGVPGWAVLPPVMVSVAAFSAINGFVVTRPGSLFPARLARTVKGITDG